MNFAFHVGFSLSLSLSLYLSILLDSQRKTSAVGKNNGRRENVIRHSSG